MNVRTIPCLLIAHLVALSATAASAAGGRPVDIPERARGAHAVVLAQTTEVTPTWESNEYGDLLIVSHVRLQVEETMKGASEASMWLDVEGGSLNGVTMRSSAMPAMAVGERAVFFIDEHADGTRVPHLKGMGILKLDATDTVPGSSLALRDIRSMVKGAGR